MTRYYTIDFSRVSLREYRRFLPNLFQFVVVAVLRVFGVSITNNALIPLIDRLHELSWHDLPEEARTALAGPVAGWERLGFRRVCVTRLPQPQKERFLAAVLLLSPDGTAHVHAMYLRRPGFVATCTPVYSLFGDGTVGMTTDLRHELDDPPTVFRSQQPAGTEPAEMWERHRANLGGPWAEAWAAVERLDAEGVRVVAVEMERREVEFHVARGVLVPVTDEEFDRFADPDAD